MVCFRLDLVVGTVSGMLKLISGSLLGCVVGGYLWLRFFGVGRYGGPGCWDVDIGVVSLCVEPAVYQRVLEVLAFCVGDEWLVWEEL